MQDSEKPGGRIALKGRLTCTDQQQLEILRRYLPEHVRLTRAEPGCLSFEVTETDDPMVWQVQELFASRAAFEAHQARTKDSDWGRESGAIQRDFQMSEVD